MSHHGNEQIQERLYEEALDEVQASFPKLSEKVQDEIAIAIARDRWHDIDEYYSNYQIKSTLLDLELFAGRRLILDVTI